MSGTKLNLRKMSTQGGDLTVDASSVSNSDRVKNIVTEENVESIHVDKTCAYPIDMDKLAGYGSTIITFTLFNGSAGTLLWGLGTPLMDPTQRVNMGFPAADLGAGTALFTDDLGAGAPKTAGVAARVLRKAAVVTRLDLIIDPTTAVGAAQRSQQITRNNLDFNLNPCNKQGRLPVSWTDFSAVVEKVVLPLDEFNGFQYPILAGASVDIDVTISAIEVPMLQNADGLC